MSDWKLTRLRGEFCIAWYERREDGTRFRRRYSLGTEDAKEAERRAPARYAELTRPQGTTVKDLWTGYCADMAGRAVVGTMQHTWKALEKRFGGLEGEAIAVADCRAHTAERRAAGIKDGTIHTELGHLRMVLLWAVDHGAIQKAPKIERPPKPEPKDGYLTREEVRQSIGAATAAHVRCFIYLVIGTGARNEAAVQLTWDRVDFDRDMIQLRNPFDNSRRKGRATIPMNATLRAELWAAKQNALTPFVIEWAGQPVKSLKKALKRLGKKIGRPDLSPHMLRHSAAVWLAEDGHSMEEIAQFLGHDDVKTTRRIYARYSPTYLRKLADSLAV